MRLSNRVLENTPHDRFRDPGSKAQAYRLEDRPTIEGPSTTVSATFETVSSLRLKLRPNLCELAYRHLSDTMERTSDEIVSAAHAEGAEIGR